MKPSLEPLLSLKPLAKLKNILLSAVLFVSAAGVTAYFWMTDPVPLMPEDVVEVSGRITQAVTVEGKHHQLRIWIDDREDPYCATGTYPSEFPEDIAERLQRAGAVAIVIEKAELESPRHNYREGFAFREIRSLSLDGVPLLTLDDSNRLSSERHLQIRWIAPLIATFCALCLGIGLRERFRADTDGRAK